MAGNNLTQMTLNGYYTRDQHTLQIQAQIPITLVGQVREISSTSFNCCLFVCLFYFPARQIPSRILQIEVTSF